MAKINKKIQELTDKIIKEAKPEKVILFGSYAWGKPGPDSDFDFFVVEKSVEPRRKRQLRLRRLLLDFDMPADILSYTPQEVEKRIGMKDLFIKKITTKGKLIYAK